MQQRVAVGLGLRDRGRADHAAGSGLVDDDEALAERLGEAVRQHPAEQVGGGAGRGRDHDLDRALRVALRAGGIGDAQECHSRQRNGDRSHGALVTSCSRDPAHRILQLLSM